MSAAPSPAGDARLRRAVDELREAILRVYPAATFSVSHGGDPEGLYLTPVVDVEDPAEEFELVLEQELPVFVVPVRPPERVAGASALVSDEG